MLMPNRLPEMWVCDLDRVFLDSEAYFEATVQASERLGLVPATTIRNMRPVLEQSKGSFDTNQFIMDQGIDQSGINALNAEIIRTTRPEDVVYPHARPLLRQIAGKFIILTKGGISTQTTKLVTAELIDDPYLITDEERKGWVIDSWELPDRSGYRVTATHGQVLEADMAILLEDKESGHEGLPNKCIGFYVSTVEPQQPLAPNVFRIDDVSRVPQELLPYVA